MALLPNDTHPLRTAIPADLATWLDAATIEETGYGEPGYPALRDAWAGRTNYEDIISDIPQYLEDQAEVQLAAQQTYERLLIHEPLHSEDGIAGWFPTWWAEVLLSMPWDDRLADAVRAAKTYIND